MRQYLALLSALVSVLALAALGAPAVAGAVSRGGITATSAPAGVTHARLGARGFGRRTPSFGSRSRYRYPRAYRRPSPFHGLGGAILRGLGIAYLFHAIFGWGHGGGSPFGLLILVALIALIVTRRRRRPMYY